MRRRVFLEAAAGLAGAAAFPRPARASRPPLRLGLALPLSGAEAAQGQSVQEAVVLALNALQRRLPRPIELHVEDTASDIARFGRALRGLVLDERVHTVLAPCPSDLRQAAVSFMEATGNLLWDPAPYEGGECSRHVIHGGPTPHQHLRHMVPWMMEQVGRRFLFVGSDLPHPRECLRVAADLLGRAGGTPLGPPLVVPPGHEDFSHVIRRIRRDRVDVVFSSLVGASQAGFLRQYREARLDPLEIPVASPTLGELDMAAAGPAILAGHVAVAPYFMDWDSPENTAFLERWRKRGGGRRPPPNAVAEAAWFQLHQMVRALEALGPGDLHPINLREAAKERQVLAPQGPVWVDADSLHTMLWPKIAVAEASGRFKVLAHPKAAVAPHPTWGYGGGRCTDAG